MSRSVIQSMQGQIAIKSEKDVGTKVIISLTLEQPTPPRLPPLTVAFGQDRVVEFVGSPMDSALYASQLHLEETLAQWGFQVLHSPSSSPVSLDSFSDHIFIIDEAGSRQLALPRRVIVLTTGEPPSSSPDGVVFLRRPLGPVKIELALRAILRIHDPLPTPRSPAESSSVSVAITSSSRSSPIVDSLPDLPSLRLPLTPRRVSRLSTTRLVSHETKPFKILVVDDNTMNRRVLNQFLKKKVSFIPSLFSPSR